jgi:hypothetical protein
MEFFGRVGPWSNARPLFGACTEGQIDGTFAAIAQQQISALIVSTDLSCFFIASRCWPS